MWILLSNIDLRVLSQDKFLLQIYTLLSEKISGLKMCVKKWQIWGMLFCTTRKSMAFGHVFPIARRAGIRSCLNQRLWWFSKENGSPWLHQLVQFWLEVGHIVQHSLYNPKSHDEMNILCKRVLKAFFHWGALILNFSVCFTTLFCPLSLFEFFLLLELIIILLIFIIWWLGEDLFVQ